MNQKFNIISILLMAILVVLLCFVMGNYYTKSKVLSSGTPINMSMTDELLSSEDNNAIVSNYNGNDNAEGDKIISLGGEDADPSGDDESPSGNGEDNLGNIPEQVAPPENQVVITSDDNISDNEKKEVLKELDETLMNLLDVVDKVQIVDETRLGTDESEVQP